MNMGHSAVASTATAVASTAITAGCIGASVAAPCYAGGYLCTGENPVMHLLTNIPGTKQYEDTQDELMQKKADLLKAKADRTLAEATEAHRRAQGSLI